MSPERTVLLKEEVDSSGMKTVVTRGPSRVIFFNGKDSEKTKEPALFFPDSYGNSAYIVVAKAKLNGSQTSEVEEGVDKSLAELVVKEISSLKGLSEEMECHPIFDMEKWNIDTLKTCAEAGIKLNGDGVYRVALIAIAPDEDHSWV